MSNYASAEETHRLRLLRGDNYQGNYQPQWVRLTADTVKALDVKNEKKQPETFVTRERSESIQSDESGASASTEHVEFKGVRLL